MNAVSREGGGLNLGKTGRVKVTVEQIRLREDEARRPGLILRAILGHHKRVKAVPMGTGIQIRTRAIPRRLLGRRGCRTLTSGTIAATTVAINKLGRAVTASGSAERRTGPTKGAERPPAAAAAASAVAAVALLLLIGVIGAAVSHL
jgi:hypothetical protein